MRPPLSPRFLLRAYRDASPVDTHDFPLPPLLATQASPSAPSSLFSAFGCSWKLDITSHSAPTSSAFSPAAPSLHVTFRLSLIEGNAPPVAMGVLLPLPDWSREVYVLLPGAAYGGNRLGSRAVNYSPRYPEADAGPHARPLITDLPRLSDESTGPSRMQHLTGDLASPAFGAHWPNGRTVFLAATDTAPGALWEVEETDDRRHAHFALLTPGVRATRYSFQSGSIRTDHPSPDRGRRLSVGESLQLAFQLESTDTASLDQLFERLFDFHDAVLAETPARHELPLSAAFDLVEAKRNREDWSPDLGIYCTTNLHPGQTHNLFQTGWCGGIIAESALLAGRQPDSLKRAPHSLTTIATRAARPTGWLAGKCHADGTWTADFIADAARPWTHRWTLLRRQADALWYFLAAAERHTQLTLTPAPEAWLKAARGLAEAFTALRSQAGAPGQFIDIETGRVELGGSTSGALAPAGLCAAATCFNEPRYLETAAFWGNYYYEHHTRLGLTTGGPADAMQAPDSESAASLVDSFLALHEAAAPGGPWLDRARCAAAQLASWVMPYDFVFPPDSEFGRLGIPTAGSVFANVQNRHAAGLCTHSGLSLLRLFRHTGDLRLLRLVASIARFQNHVVSRPDRPIQVPDGRALPSGWINERVNTSDWDHNVGGIFYGSTWCEVALMLTAVELPSVYAQPDTGTLACLDHLEAVWLDSTHTALRMTNPTRFPARVRCLVETSAEATAKPFGPAAALALAELALAPGETVVVPVSCPVPHAPQRGVT